MLQDDPKFPWVVSNLRRSSDLGAFVALMLRRKKVLPAPHR